MLATNMEGRLGGRERMHPQGGFVPQPRSFLTIDDPPLLNVKPLARYMGIRATGYPFHPTCSIATTSLFFP